ncbi:xaa-Pro aminopeptidase 1-like [Octopus sinensis]|uniref:Xaa-Pro aminopeptidase 1-like n=1 Tax=Octopus sinensis TaxID=2607531 RepID=A0A6P7U7Q4_9MOLL|nr:xaa-Pro aminopeptidase 1-like [Octopus sinensis]
MSVSQSILSLLRKQFTLTSPPINGYIIPTSDEHQSEYTPANTKRRQFISKFTGSAGTAVVTTEKAALWTDGRYWNQASTELDLDSWILMKQGISPLLHSNRTARYSLYGGLAQSNEWESLSKKLDQKKMSLVPVEDNLVDRIWTDRPPTPKSRIFPLEIKYSGQSWEEKIPKSSSYFAAKQIDSPILQTDWSPISRLKAVKNPTESAGMELAHLKDAVALTEFFYWLETTSFGELTVKTSSKRVFIFTNQDQIITKDSQGLEIAETRAKDLYNSDCDVTEDMLDTAKDLISHLMFTYQPETFENPSVRRFYSTLEAMALDMNDVEEFEDHTCSDFRLYISA